MGLEFGKWLLDVAKYMLTALLLANVFADIDSAKTVWLIIVLVISVLGLGLWIIHKSGDGENGNKLLKNKRKKGK